MNLTMKKKPTILVFAFGVLLLAGLNDANANPRKWWRTLVSGAKAALGNSATTAPARQGLAEAAATRGPITPAADPFRDIREQAIFPAQEAAVESRVYSVIDVNSGFKEIGLRPSPDAFLNLVDDNRNLLWVITVGTDLIDLETDQAIEMDEVYRQLCQRDNVICVAATDGRHLMRGSNLHVSDKVAHLAAPGVIIDCNADPDDPFWQFEAGTICLAKRGAAYASRNVSEAVQKILQAYPEASPLAVKSILEKTVSKGGSQTIARGTIWEGRLNPKAAIELAKRIQAEQAAHRLSRIPMTSEEKHQKD